MIQPRGRIFAAMIAFIGVLSLLLQSYFSITEALQRGETIYDGIFTLLGYFTILTNAWVAWVMARIALQRWPGGDQPSVSAISATTLYIGLVGLIYHFVLSSLWHLEGLKKMADNGMHYVVPSCTVLFWIGCVPKQKLRYSEAATWMLYPLGYCAYTLVRGAVTKWYPYPFLKVTEIGWPQTLINALALSALFYVIGLALIALLRNSFFRAKGTE